MLNEHLRDLRKQAGYSQQQMANKLHLSQGAVSQWETGQTTPSAEQLVAIAQIFGISVDEVLEVKKIKPPKKETINETLVDMIVSLSPSEVQRVMDFVAGMKANDKA